MFNKQCVDSCPEGYYGYNSIIKQCLPCDNTCINCIGSSTNCTKCPWGYYLLNGVCASQCPPGTYSNNDLTNLNCLPCESPCTQCLSLYQCSFCLAGYYLTPDKRCVTNCSVLNTNNASISTTVSYYANPSTLKC